MVRFFDDIDRVNSKAYQHPQVTKSELEGEDRIRAAYKHMAKGHLDRISPFVSFTEAKWLRTQFRWLLGKN